MLDKNTQKEANKMANGYSPIYNQAIRNIPIFEVTAWSAFTNQPTNDQFEIVSNSASDTQRITVWYTETGSSVVKYETLTLTGTTAVASVSTTVANVIGAFLGERFGAISLRAVGTITIRKKTGALAITTIAATKLSTGAPYFYLQGNNVKVQNITGKTWINTIVTNGIVSPATTTGATMELESREVLPIKVYSYLSLVSDGTGSTCQIIVEES
jgi:hypothetical protein